MYLGKMVELADVGELYAHPRHPYTVALLSAIPNPNPRIRKKRIVLKGDIPSPAAPPSGCRFHTRCWLRERLGNPERCAAEEPVFREVAPGHQAACHFSEEMSTVDEMVTAAIGLGGDGAAQAPAPPPSTVPPTPPTAPPPG